MIQPNIEVVIKGSPESYSFRQPDKLYYGQTTGRYDDGNVVITTADSVIFGNTEYDKFSVPENTLFAVELLRLETAKITRNPLVRLVEKIADSTVGREIYLPESKCRLRVAETVKKTPSGAVRRVVAELLDHHRQKREYCPVCFRTTAATIACQPCLIAFTEFYEVWELDEQRRRKSFFGTFGSASLAAEAINSYCFRHAIESGVVAEDAAVSDFDPTPGEEFWEIKILPVPPGKVASRRK